MTDNSASVRERVLAVLNGPARNDAHNQIKRIAGKLAGTAVMIGLRRIGKAIRRKTGQTRFCPNCFHTRARCTCEQSVRAIDWFGDAG